jgi:hypothetical protein
MSKYRFFRRNTPSSVVECAPMKKNHLTAILSLSVFGALTLQSFALVPPPESLRAAKHKEQAKSPGTDTTVITSERTASYISGDSFRTAVFMPHQPSCILGDSFRTAVFMPHQPSCISGDSFRTAVFMPHQPPYLA